MKSIDTLQREIRDLETKITFAVAPPLAHLQSEVQRLTTLVALDPKHRPDLFDANQRLQEATTTHAGIADMKKQLEALRYSLAAAEQDKRQQVIALANSRLAQAINEYEQAAVLTCRAYKQMLEAQANCHRTPGAKSDIPEGPSFPHLVPAGWQGTTAEHIRTGSLSWLNAEKAAA